MIKFFFITLCKYEFLVSFYNSTTFFVYLSIIYIFKFFGLSIAFFSKMEPWNG